MSGRDFDPLDGVFSSIVGPEEDPIGVFEDLHNSAPGEALDSPKREVGPVRRVRTDSPDFIPAPRLPYPFDGSDGAARAAVKTLCSVNSWNQTERKKAAEHLFLAYEARHGERLDLHSLLSFWWRAARCQVDIAAENGFPPDNPDLPQRSPSAFFGKLHRAAAFDFASAKGVPDHLLRETLQAAGVAVPPPAPRRRKKV